MEIMVFLTKETSQDIIFTSEWLLSVGFQQKKIFVNNLSFPIKDLHENITQTKISTYTVYGVYTCTGSYMYFVL